MGADTVALPRRVASPVIDELVARAKEARAQALAEVAGDVAVLDQLEAGVKEALVEAGFDPIVPRTAQCAVLVLNLVVARAEAHGLDEAAVSRLCGELAAVVSVWA